MMVMVIDVVLVLESLLLFLNLLWLVGEELGEGGVLMEKRGRGRYQIRSGYEVKRRRTDGKSYQNNQSGYVRYVPNLPR